MYPHVGYGFGFAGLGLLLVILFIVLIVIGIALLVRRPVAPAPAAPVVDARSQAQRILEERFARGEIDEPEYRARLEVLLGAGWIPGSVTAPSTTGAAPATVAAPISTTTPPSAGDNGGQE